MQLGLLGASFDPIHNWHLHLAKSAQEQANLDLVLFIPSKSPHKLDRKQLKFEDRYNIVAKTLQNPDPDYQDSKFKLSDIDLKRPNNEVSYSYLTVKAAQALHPKANLYWIMGEDSYFSLDNWEKPLEFLESCSLIVAPRPESAQDAVLPLIKSPANQNKSNQERKLSQLKQPQIIQNNPYLLNKIQQLKITANPVSSSEIRKMINQDNNLEYLNEVLPATTKDLIYKLYKDQNVE